jgi:hypothetical protein
MLSPHKNVLTLGIPVPHTMFRYSSPVPHTTQCIRDVLNHCRSGPSVLVFSLSLHRHPYICILFNFHLPSSVSTTFPVLCIKVYSGIVVELNYLFFFLSNTYPRDTVRSIVQRYFQPSLTHLIFSHSPHTMICESQFSPPG